MFRKIIEYSPSKKIELLKNLLQKFKQNNQIYLTFLEKNKDDKSIQEQLTTSSFTILEINNFAELIKQFKHEEIKKNYLII